MTRPARLAAIDAQNLWMSAKIPNDQFLLYAFAGRVPLDEALVARLRHRAQDCADLRLRVSDTGGLRYPRWVDDEVPLGRFTTCNDDLDWASCLNRVAALAESQLDAAVDPWRLHVFGSVRGAPTGDPEVTVAVLQMSHALADGQRSAALAAWLFGRPDPVPSIPTRRCGFLPYRGWVAARTQRELDRDIAEGVLTAPPSPRPLLPSNVEPGGFRDIRVLVRDRAALTGSGGTVTLNALDAIGQALSDHLRGRGADPTQLGAEVPMAKSGIRYARNHFGNVGVGLYPGLARSQRQQRIAEDLRNARLRAEHPAAAAASQSLAAIPAPLLRWGTTQFDPAVRATAVIGNTVVSSVNRGPADLFLGGAPVCITAGFPALSPMMSLTHGVHGIGERIAISVHCAETAFSAEHLDDYICRLDHALGPGG